MGDPSSSQMHQVLSYTVLCGLPSSLSQVGHLVEDERKQVAGHMILLAMGNGTITWGNKGTLWDAATQGTSVSLLGSYVKMDTQMLVSRNEEK
jgi:hypothetical protein